MESYFKVLNAVKYVGGTTLSLGMVLFIFGLVISHTLITGLGMGAIVGAIFIFIIGVFFVVTEEMLEKTDKGTLIVPTKAGAKVIPFKIK
ncbi:hypothetical protein [Mesobacillus maritimus]|uniref:Uncharacterized protein n=1 Tax=Mesobacillus maritimus TaxID=1643336 RepID=A0ABS7K3K6_9BACI|nr:hypothetical protein [Mesobacillus maritimus]MBY0096834.1 hypothetical protein [Mesobacillus maritimus]